MCVLFVMCCSCFKLFLVECIHLLYLKYHECYNEVIMVILGQLLMKYSLILSDIKSVHERFLNLIKSLILILRIGL